MSIINSLRQAVSGGKAQTIMERLFEKQSTHTHKSRRSQLDANHNIPPFFLANDRVATNFAKVDWTFRVDGTAVTDHPIVDMHSQPNPFMSGYHYRKLISKYLNIVGEAISVVLPKEPGSNRLEVYPFPPHDCQPTQEGNWLIHHENFQVEVEPVSVFYIKRPDLLKPYGRGRGKGEVLSDELDIIQSALEMERASFQNNARPDLLINMEGANEDAKQTFEQMWKDKLMGPQNSGKPLITASRGELDVKDITPPLKETIIDELRQMSYEDTERVFGLLPSIAGRIKDTNRATIRTERFVFSEQTTIPQLKEYAQALQKDIFSLYQENITAEWDDPRPKDVQRKRNIMNERPEAYTYNEFRILSDHEPVPWGERRARRPDTNLVEVEAETPGLEMSDIDMQQRDLPEIDIELVENEYTKEVEIDFEPYRAQSEEAGAVADRIQQSDFEQLRGSYEERMRQARSNEADQQGSDEGSILPESAIALLVAAWVDGRAPALNNTTRKHVGEIVDRGVVEGKSTSKVLKELRDYRDNIPNRRSAPIAKTEMTRLRNEVAWNAIKNVGRQTKIWLSMMDEKVRLAHNDLHGEEVAVDEPFVYRGFEAQFPGDFGVDRLDIGCRCFLTHSEEPGKELDKRSRDLEDVFKSLDDNTQKLVDEFKPDVTSVLDFQVTKAIDEAREVLRGRN